MKQIVMVVSLLLVAGLSWAGKPTPPVEISTIEISTVGEELKFSIKEFKVAAGAKFKLFLRNNSTGMPHNLVVLKPGSDPVAVGNKGIQAGPDKNWVPQTPEVLFSTTLVQPKHKGEFEFTAPKEKGKYPFVCTFPGHVMTMQGHMIVE